MSGSWSFQRGCCELERNLSRDFHDPGQPTSMTSNKHSSHLIHVVLFQSSAALCYSYFSIGKHIHVFVWSLHLHSAQLAIWIGMHSWRFCRCQLLLLPFMPSGEACCFWFNQSRSDVGSTRLLRQVLCLTTRHPLPCVFIMYMHGIFPFGHLVSLSLLGLHFSSSNNCLNNFFFNILLLCDIAQLPIFHRSFGFCFSSLVWLPFVH